MSILYSMCVPHPPLIIPEIGQGEEKTISNTIQSYESIMKYVSTLPIETVIVISPHAIAYSDYIHISPGIHASGDFSQFHAGNVRIEVDYDTELVKKITQSAKKHHIFAGTLGKDDDLDHGTMIPLYFLNKYLKDYKVVRIGISGLSPLTHYRFGQCIKEAVGDKNVLLIASGDLSHCLKEDGPYGYKEEGRLRGCIGTFMPVQDNIALEIVHNAISACSEDPRFDPITEEELDNLVISVDVLGEIEPVEDISTLDPRIYGIIVSHGSKRGLLLPSLEGVDTVTDQIQIACHKAGIHEGEKIKIERFRVIRHG